MQPLTPLDGDMRVVHMAKCLEVRPQHARILKVSLDATVVKYGWSNDHPLPVRRRY